MKRQVKMLAAAVILSGIGFAAVSQTRANLNADIITINSGSWNPGLGHRLNLMGGTMNFGTSNATVYSITSHSGFFSVRGTSFGIGAAGGEFSANRATIYNDITARTYNGVIKHFVHPHPTNDAKVIRYTSMESAEALTVARGVAKTVNGQVTIELPEHFVMVTSKTEPVTVILTPKGAPAMLYAKESNREKVVVAMKPFDFSEYKDIEFSYQITGTRDGFEQLEVIVAEEKLGALPTKEDFEKNEVTKRIKALFDRTAARHEAAMEKQ
jgi:hypothetical protein